MRFSASRAGLLALYLLALPAAASAEAVDPSMKSIEIEWEEVPNAESYIVKLTPSSTPDAEPLYFTTKAAQLRESVPIGTYELRIRSKSKEADVYSRWSEPSLFEVAFKETRPVFPEDRAVIEAKSVLQHDVEFRWTPVAKVKRYHITIWTEDAKDKPYEFTTSATSKVLSVKTGRQYFWQVRFESATDVSYAQVPPTFGFLLIGPKLITPSKPAVTRVPVAGAVTAAQRLSWTKSTDAEEYELDLSYHFLDESEFHSLRKFRQREIQWLATGLNPGAYRLTVVATAPRRVSSDAMTFDFIVKPTRAELERE